MALLPTVRTPIRADQVANAVIPVAETLSQPSRDWISLLVAQTLVECGADGMHCYGWNIGNKRPSQGEDYQHLKGAGEELPLAEAERQQKAAPGQVRIVARYTRAGVPYASVKYDPPHPASRFAAYKTLEAGIAAWLAWYRKRPTAIDAARIGPQAFADELYRLKYFTASAAHYGKMLLDRRVQVMREVRPLTWGDIPETAADYEVTET